MSDIFFSYASEDRARITPLVARLESEGWGVWWDRSLIAGPTFTEEIQAALDQAKCVVVAWSEHSVTSTWCRDEANEGLERKCLVPVCIDDIKPPLGFRSSHTAALHGWPDSPGDINQFIEGVRRAIEGKENSSWTTPIPIKRDPQNFARAIAVLPFTNMSNDPEQEFFCDGLADDITIDLTHIPQLHVISRQSAFTYKNKNVDTGEVSEKLGAKFILQGSVRRAGDRMRVTAQLIDAPNRNTVWSNRYDRDVSDAFLVQDELTHEIVTALDTKLVSGERGHLQRQNKYRDSSSLELLYKGIFEYHKYEHAASLRARRYLDEFIGREPDSVLGYHWQVSVWTFALVVGWEDIQVTLQNLNEWVEKCLEIDPNDARALVGAANLNTVMGNLDEALALTDRAVEVLPNYYEAWFTRAWILSFLGRPHEAITSLEQVLSLCPILEAVQLGVLSTALRNAGRYDEAIRTLRSCAQQFPDFIFAHSGLAVIYAMQDDLDAARREVDIVLEQDQNYTITRFTTPDLYRDPTVMQECAAALRKAGLPE